MFKLLREFHRISCNNVQNYLLSISSVNMLRTTKRHFHLKICLCAKMFMEHENKHAYTLMERKGYSFPFNAQKISGSVITKEQFEAFLKEDWSKVDIKELVEVFSVLAVYGRANNIQISNTIFDSFIDNLTDNIRFASDQELQSIFNALLKWPEPESIRTRNYIEVWAALDDECLNRLQSWTYDEQLKYVSLFFMLNAIRVSDFVHKAIQRMTSKAKQLTPGQLVQTLFYVGVKRSQPIDMHNLELQLENIFPEFNVDDLAVMSMGFFKSKTPIRSLDLVSKIADKVLTQSKDIHEVSLAAILKIIRYSMKVTKDDTIYKLLDQLQHEVPRLSIMCNVHLALLGTSTLTFHQGCLDKIAEKVLMDGLSSCRLKDLERLVLTYGTFSYNPMKNGCFLTSVVEELKEAHREAEIINHGRSFACCIAYLGLLGIYPVDLMDKVLNPIFLQNIYGKQCFLYGREVLAIHNTAQIFHKDVTMNRLSEKEAKILAKKLTDYVPNENYQKQFNVTEKMFLDIYQVLREQRGGEDYIAGDHILPHHQRGDIIICNDQNGVPQPVCHVFNGRNFGLITKVPDGNKWIVLVIAGRNAIIHGSDKATGHFQAKIRELKALGYNAALVPYTRYSILKTKEDKYNYLTGIIEEAIN